MQNKVYFSFVDDTSFLSIGNMNLVVAVINDLNVYSYQIVCYLQFRFA